MRKNKKFKRAETVKRGFYIFSFTRAGRALADRLAREFNEAKKALPNETKAPGLKKKVGSLFKDNGFDIVFIGATGIAVRSIAPFLRGKDKDPAVVTLDDAGTYAISLLSGHLGGANALAGIIARCIGAKAIITTATDILRLPAIEDLTIAFDMAIEDIKKIKVVNSAIINGKKVIVVDSNAARRKAMKTRFKDSPFLFRRAVPKKIAKNGALAIVSSEYKVRLPVGMAARAIVLRPKDISVGIGCRRGVSSREIETAIDQTFRNANVSKLCIKKLATVDIKRDERGLIAYAKKARLPIAFFTAFELGRIKPPSGESAYVKKWLGIGAVAEPAALKGSKAKRIWLKKKIHGRVTISAAKRAY